MVRAQSSFTSFMSGHGRELTWVARLYLWATERLYDELAWAYDLVSWAVSVGRWSQWRRLALEHVAGERILEIGFGTGDLLIEMADLGWHVWGLEPSRAMQRVTTHKLARRGLWVPRLEGHAQALPFADASFDAIVATFPAPYILSPATWVEAARVLNPTSGADDQCGGRLIIAGLFVETDSALLRWVSDFFFGRPRGDLISKLEQIAATVGFEMSVATQDGARFRSPVMVLQRRRRADALQAACTSRQPNHRVDHAAAGAHHVHET